MAINFFLRSTNGTSSTIYFRYTKNREFKVILKTPYTINPLHWCNITQGYKKELIPKNPKLPELKKKATDIIDFNNKLNSLKNDIENYMIHHHDAEVNELKEYYNTQHLKKNSKPQLSTPTIPLDLVNFIDFYIKEKSKRLEGIQEPITEATRKKIITIKNRIIIYEKKILSTIL